MEFQELMLRNSWISLIFENKNKTYGAYELRHEYATNINRALIVAVTVFVLAISGPVIVKALFPEKKSEEVIDLVKVELLAPPPVDPKAPPPPPPPKLEIPQVKVETVKFLPPKIEDDEKVTEEMVTQDEVKEAVISNVTQEGEKGNENELIVDNTGGTGNAVVEEPKEEVFLVVEQMPEFPGGAGEMYKFIGKNIRYPAQARSMGIEGRVIITFVVNAQGSITDPVIVKGIGGGCDEEALRVVKMMPNWTVGKQNGRAVSVKFTIPIKFTLSQ